MDNTAKGFAQKIVSELEHISAAIREYLQHPHDGTPGNQNRTTNEAGNAEIEIRPSGSAAPKPKHPGVAHQKTTYEKNTKRLKKAKPWIEAIGLIVLIAYTGYAGCQVSLMREANKIATGSFQIGQRAYLSIKRIEDNAGLIKIFFENYGHVPMTKFSTRIDWDRINSDSMAVIERRSVTTQDPSGKATFPPGPAGEFSITINVPVLTAEQFSNIQSLSGVITYDTGFGSIDTLPICMMKVPTNPWRQCGLGTFIDLQKAQPQKP